MAYRFAADVTGRSRSGPGRRDRVLTIGGVLDLLTEKT